MTLTRRRVRMSKYIAQVNTVGANVGAKLSYFNIINIKQLLKASKWRCCQTNKIRYRLPFIVQKIELV